MERATQASNQEELVSFLKSRRNKRLDRSELQELVDSMKRILPNVTESEIHEYTAALPHWYKIKLPSIEQHS